jgi:Methyltransferase domain
MREKYEITYDCFSSRIPQWRRDLAHFAGAPNIKYLEIGYFEGYSVCWLLDNILTNNSSRLVCIDIFDNGQAERLYDLNISRSGASCRVVKLKGLSEDELVSLEKGSFDFIYVDGCHKQEKFWFGMSAISEINLWLGVLSQFVMLRGDVTNYFASCQIYRKSVAEVIGAGNAKFYKCLAAIQVQQIST